MEYEIEKKNTFVYSWEFVIFLGNERTSIRINTPIIMSSESQASRSAGE